MVLVVMPARTWILCVLLAAIVVLPVVLRLMAGDDPPDNAIRQEQPGDGDHDPIPRNPAGGEFRLVA